jgi:hypothetical protein
MGWDSEQAERGFDGYDDREYGYMPGPRRHKTALEQTPKTCRRCGVGRLHWVCTVKGWRLHELVGMTDIPHFCDPVKRGQYIASTEQFNRDHDYRAHCERVGKPL